MPEFAKYNISNNTITVLYSLGNVDGFQSSDIPFPDEARGKTVQMDSAPHHHDYLPPFFLFHININIENQISNHREMASFSAMHPILCRDKFPISLLFNQDKPFPTLEGGFPFHPPFLFLPKIPSEEASGMHGLLHLLSGGQE